MISVSLVILTWNRMRTVSRSLAANLKSSGYPIREIIHVDNGSERGFAERFQEEFWPAIQVRHDTNLGVSKGYNRGMLLATSSHIAITGCDRIMPDNWLREMVSAATVIPETCVVSVYSGDYPERCREPITLNGLRIVPALPFEAKLFSRDFLLKCGFFREDFGLYGYEDCEWADRAERVARELQLVNYILPHIGNAVELPDHDDFTATTAPGAYDQFKTSENNRPEKLLLKDMCWALGNPHYDPYSRFEPTPPLHTLPFHEWCGRAPNLPEDMNERRALYVRYARGC